VCGNIEDARAWVAEVLGGLAADTDSDARLRETFRVFRNNGASYTLPPSNSPCISTQRSTDWGAL
jgi:hypothetical protein